MNRELEHHVYSIFGKLCNVMKKSEPFTKLFMHSPHVLMQPDSMGEVAPKGDFR